MAAETLRRIADGEIPKGDVLARLPDILTATVPRIDADQSIIEKLRLLLHDHGVGARRHRRTSHDADAFAGPTAPL